jgi:hypothetical protein
MVVAAAALPSNREVRMNNKVIAGVVAVVVVFLIGFVPQYVKCHRLENELQECHQQIQGAQLRDLIGIAYVEANQKNFVLQLRPVANSSISRI